MEKTNPITSASPALKKNACANHVVEKAVNRNEVEFIEIEIFRVDLELSWKRQYFIETPRKEDDAESTTM